MQRTKELETYLQEYRAERAKVKKAQLDENWAELISPLGEKIDLLVEEQAGLQETGEQERIKYLCFFRLRTSGYTQSYETTLAMSNRSLYLDKNMNYVYWKPELIYETIVKDMEHVENLLNRKFIRLEKYELSAMRQKLLSDDWELFCTVLPQLVQGIEDRITGSSLLLKEELQVLCGGYMEKPETVCCIGTKV